MTERKRIHRKRQAEEVVLWANRAPETAELKARIQRHGYTVVWVATASESPVVKSRAGFFWGYPGILTGLAIQD